MSNFEKYHDYNTANHYFALALRYEEYESWLYWWNRVDSATADLIRKSPKSEQLDLIETYNNRKEFFSGLLLEAIENGFISV